MIEKRYICENRTKSRIKVTNDVKYYTHELKFVTGTGTVQSVTRTFPEVYSYLNWGERECAYDVLKENMGAMSHGEKIIAQFLLGVWTHNDHDFDILEAASVLDDETRQLITDWLMDPFWP